jgi:hypothetical protein
MARSDGWDNVREFGQTVRKTATVLKFLSGLRRVHKHVIDEVARQEKNKRRDKISGGLSEK